MSGQIAPPDLVTPEEKARRKAVVKGWTFRLKDQYDVPFANHCMAYIKGYRDDPPAPYADPAQDPEGLALVQAIHDRKNRNKPTRSLDE